MRPRVQFAALLLLISTAVAQESSLPPGVLLVSKIKRHMRAELDRLADYTCLETVQRSRKEPGARDFKPADTLRLELLYSDGKELYASPGDRRFRGESPVEFLASGMIGSGAFATDLHNLFATEAARFTYRGDDELEGRHAVKYDFVISLMHSAYTITLADNSGRVAMKGSFWADPDSLDIRRLEIHADDIPLNLPLTDVQTIINYARTRIGATDILLPQSAELRMAQTSGEIAVNAMAFTHCRAYQAESTIRFDTPSNPDAFAIPMAARASVEEDKPLPAGLSLTLVLSAPIDEKAMVGARIEAKVSGSVLEKGKTIVPEGAVVTGRLRRLEQYAEDGGYFAVGLEFTDIEFGGSSRRFFADLQAVDPGAKTEWTLTTEKKETTGQASTGRVQVTKGQTIRLTELPGVGSFFIRGRQLRLPAGLKTVWRTRDLTEPTKPSPRSANR